MNLLADDIIQLYEAYVGAYDKQRSRALMEKSWLDRFLDLTLPGAAVLDLGCGLGEPIGRYVAECGFSVTGADAAPSMIARARARQPQQEWIVADMRRLALGRQFGAVLAWDSFFHLSPAAQGAMFSVFGRHAGPGAPLMFTAGPQAGEAVGEWQGAALYHASLSEEDYRRLLADEDFDLLEFVREDPACGRHTICLARKRGG